MPTSNKGFKEWGAIFGDDVMAAALIDRLVHYCHLVTIGQQLAHAAAHRAVADAARATGSRARSRPAVLSGGHDEVRLVLSSMCRIFSRRNCQILGSVDTVVRHQGNPGRVTRHQSP